MKILLSIWAALAFAHLALAHVLVDSSAVSSMLSAGPHTPLHWVALALGFYALRLTILIVAPTVAVGYFGYRCVRWCEKKATRTATR